MQIKKNRLSDLHNNEVEFPREKLHLSYVKSPGFYYGYKTLGENFDNTVALHGERPAMISRFFDKIYPREMVWTWNQMNEMVTNLALGLLNLGLKKGDKMGICADSTPNFWIPQLACAKKGWLHSGDVGLINKDGNLKIIGRSGDKINRGGEIIYVREVEEILFKHPKIMEINIVGYPDKAMDERSCAFVILKKKDETLTREEIVGFLAGKIAKYKIPDRIEFVDSFPLSAGGKVQKFKLKKIIAEKVKNKISD